MITPGELGCVPVEDHNNADNLAIVLASYFERHEDRPNPDPEGEIEGWGEWAIKKSNEALRFLTVFIDQQVSERKDEIYQEGFEAGYECGSEENE